MSKNKKGAAKVATERGTDKIQSLFDDLEPNKPFPRNQGEDSVPLPANLYIYGFGHTYGAPRKPKRREICLCRAWLDEWSRPRKTINGDYGSYFLKHVVERWCGEYIPNGAFIAAAIESGCDYVRQGPNARFNLSYEAAKKNTNRKISGWTY